MADVSKIFKPRRGKISTMLGTKASTVLAAGEMFFEVPDNGVGSGRGRIMMGDGSSTYVNLAGANNNSGADSQAAKYFMPFTQDEVIIHAGTADKTVSASSALQVTGDTFKGYLNNAKSGNTLKNIIHNLREAIYTTACDIAYLNNETVLKLFDTYTPPGNTSNKQVLNALYPKFSTLNKPKSYVDFGDGVLHEVINDVTQYVTTFIWWSNTGLGYTGLSISSNSMYTYTRFIQNYVYTDASSNIWSVTRTIKIYYI